MAFVLFIRALSILLAVSCLLSPSFCGIRTSILASISQKFWKDCLFPDLVLQPTDPSPCPPPPLSPPTSAFVRSDLSRHLSSPPTCTSYLRLSLSYTLPHLKSEPHPPPTSPKSQIWDPLRGGVECPSTTQDTHLFCSCMKIAKSLYKTIGIYMDYWLEDSPNSVFIGVHVDRKEVMIMTLMTCWLAMIVPCIFWCVYTYMFLYSCPGWSFHCNPIM